LVFGIRKECNTKQLVAIVGDASNVNEIERVWSWFAEALKFTSSAFLFILSPYPTSKIRPGPQINTSISEA
jgi:hypothetical protein